MKKFITSILIAAAALTACSKSEEITLNTPNKVTFTATAELPESRSVLVEEAGKYHAEWVAGDYLELYEITITDVPDSTGVYHYEYIKAASASI